MIRRAAAIATSAICLLAGQAFAQSDDLLSPIEFRNAVIEAMQAESETELCVARLSDDSFRAGLTQESCDYFAYLDNLYDDYLADPTSGEDIISENASNYVRLITAGIDDENFAERLVVQLRPSNYVTTNARSTNGTLVARPFAGDMVAVLMLDSPETLAAVSEERLAANEVSVDEAYQLAIENTRARMGDVFTEEYKKINFLSSSNGLISGQLWLPETCSSESRDAAYMVYDRNGLMKVNLSDPLGLSNLLAVANGLVIQGEALTTSVVRCKNGEWTQLWPTQTAEIQAVDPRL